MELPNEQLTGFDCGAAGTSQSFVYKFRHLRTAFCNLPAAAPGTEVKSKAGQGPCDRAGAGHGPGRARAPPHRRSRLPYASNPPPPGVDLPPSPSPSLHLTGLLQVVIDPQGLMKVSHIISLPGLHPRQPQAVVLQGDVHQVEAARAAAISEQQWWIWRRRLLEPLPMLVGTLLAAAAPACACTAAMCLLRVTCRSPPHLQAPITPLGSNSWCCLRSYWTRRSRRRSRCSHHRGNSRRWRGQGVLRL